MTPSHVTWRTSYPPVQGDEPPDHPAVGFAANTDTLAPPFANGCHTLIAQLLSFISIGALATGLQYLLTAGLVLAVGLPLIAASTTSFLISAVFNYWANARLTFATQGGQISDPRQQLRFVTMVALGCALNAALLHVAVMLGAHPVLAQLTATAGVLASNFMLSRLWVFRKP